MASGQAPQEGEFETDLNKELHRWDNLANSFDLVLLYSPEALTGEYESLSQLRAGQLRNLADGLLCMVRSRRDVKEIVRQVETITAKEKVQMLGVVQLKK